MRKKPPGKLLPSAHQIEREYRIMEVLGGVGFPVPQMILFCEDPAVIGTPFYVMKFVRGRIFRDPALQGLEPTEKKAIYDEFIKVAAQLHSIDYKFLGLEDYGPSGNYYARQVSIKNELKFGRMFVMIFFLKKRLNDGQASMKHQKQVNWSR